MQLKYKNGAIILRQEDESRYAFVDDGDIKWKVPNKYGYCFDMVDHPLKDAVSIQDLEDYNWPDLRDSDLFERIESTLGKEGEKLGR